MSKSILDKFETLLDIYFLYFFKICQDSVFKCRLIIYLSVTTFRITKTLKNETELPFETIQTKWLKKIIAIASGKYSANKTDIIYSNYLKI